MVEEALQLSLKKLDMDYVDLYLMHWPVAWDGTCELPPQVDYAS